MVILWLAVGTGCSETPRAEPVTTGTPAAEAQPEGSGPGRCGALGPGVLPLTSYVSAAVPGTYALEMVWRGNEWTPAEYIDLPLHHAGRLELSGPELERLVAHQNRRLRFTVAITDRTIEAVPNRREARVTYRARVVDVCVP